MKETGQTNMSVNLTLKPAGSQLPVGLPPERPNCSIISNKHVSVSDICIFVGG